MKPRVTDQSKFSNPCFERRVYACKTCKRSLEVCPDCSARLIHHHPIAKIFCTEHNVETEHTMDFERPGECMGNEGVYVSAVFECPVCYKLCSPSEGKLEDVYTGTPE